MITYVMLNIIIKKICKKLKKLYIKNYWGKLKFKQKFVNKNN